MWLQYEIHHFLIPIYPNNRKNDRKRFFSLVVRDYIGQIPIATEAERKDRTCGRDDRHGGGSSGSVVENGSSPVEQQQRHTRRMYASDQLVQLY